MYSRMEAVWSKEISFDGKIYIDYDREEWKPPKLYKRNPVNLLKSDSRHRKDIPLRRELRMEESQREK